VEDAALLAGATADVEDSHPGLEAKETQHPGVDVTGPELLVDVDPRLQVLRCFSVVEHHLLNL
jgi:hypothetical protein